MKASYAVAALAFVAVGCAAPAAEESDESADAISQGSTEGIVYFHGMSQLGFASSMVEAQIGERDALLPKLSDTGLRAVPGANVRDFLAGHERTTIAGYSLGRVPVLRLMLEQAPGVSRTVLIDPTYDGSYDLGWSVGGGIARTWLDADESRSFLLVYGDVTKQIGGEQSFVTALSDHPRAELCYVPGDHARFRAADMAYALVAKDCADLHAHLK